MPLWNCLPKQNERAREISKREEESSQHARLERGRSSGSLAVSGMHGVVIQDVLDRDRLVSTKRRGKTATGRPAHQVRYSAEAQQRRQLKLAKPMLSSLRASASVVVA